MPSSNYTFKKGFVGFHRYNKDGDEPKLILLKKLKKLYSKFQSSEVGEWDIENVYKLPITKTTKIHFNDDSDSSKDDFIKVTTVIRDVSLPLNNAGVETNFTTVSCTLNIYRFSPPSGIDGPHMRIYGVDSTNDADLREFERDGYYATVSHNSDII